MANVNSEKKCIISRGLEV